MHSPTDLESRFPDLPRVLYIHGVSVFKWPELRRCFPGRTLLRLWRARAVPADAWVVTWGSEALPASLPASVRVLRIEDGFLRSVGLGVDLIRPMSWVIDRQGIHYDPLHPSDLETMLGTREFNEELRQRAAFLRTRIVAGRVTKYNVGSGSWRRPANRSRVILVPGQVPTDAAVSFDALQPAVNIALLRAVRKANPDAYILYKVHPDIVARMRVQRDTVAEALAWCDEVVGDVNLAELLTEIDEVHVLTSLSGFEALLRGCPVTCYGRPFYSGWGLTCDMVPASERRRRRLTLDELVAGALIEYPIYMNRRGSGLLTPEESLDALLAWRARREPRPAWWRGACRMVLRRVAGVR